MADEEAQSDGWKLLDEAWFAALDDLLFTMESSEDTKSRIAAADTVLRYALSLGQSINLPYIPEKRPPMSMHGRDEDEDEDES